VAVSTQTVMRGAKWVLSAVSGPGGPDAVYGAQCTTCYESTGDWDDARPVSVWAVEHMRAHPQHCGYELVTRTQWRVDPGPAFPHASIEVPVEGSVPGPAGAGSARPQDRRIHHARSPLTRRLLGLVTGRPAWVLARWTAAAIRRSRAWILPFAGPLFLAALSASLGFRVGALFAPGTG
jgi:hypothetical protein